ncbi:MAG TPA: hydroxymethylglutaryl-CoA lyase [Chitinophagaceae bacterium]|nr:hydroxymethylglutaryl-CoA lyase [Chitinophagaceae bacterium]
MEMEKITLVECPRDAMQGWKTFIPTGEKIAYLNALLQVGFDVLDFGSFVSAAAIPQMADTREVLEGLRPEHSRSRLLAIVANLRGAEEAAAYAQIDCLGFPFSVSPTFQLRNAHAGLEESFGRVAAIQELCRRHGKQLVVYLSMGFGNPYGDPWSQDLVRDWARRLASLGIGVISLADTVGLASPEQVEQVTRRLVEDLPGVEIGVHLHSTPYNRQPKLEAALRAGCRRFDGALGGVGGCPMAGDELVGNMDSEWMIRFFRDRNLLGELDWKALDSCLDMAKALFH